MLSAYLQILVRDVTAHPASRRRTFQHCTLSKLQMENGINHSKSWASSTSYTLWSHIIVDIDKPNPPSHLKLHILRRDLARRLLSVLISLHRRQAKRRNKELPSAKSERQILPDAISSASSTFASLCDQRQLVHLHHALRLLFLRRSRGGVV